MQQTLRVIQDRRTRLLLWYPRFGQHSVPVHSQHAATMRLLNIISVGFFSVVILAQETFEPSDFDVTAALLENGVDVSDIPSLAGISKRTKPGGCEIAVRLTRRP